MPESPPPKAGQPINLPSFRPHPTHWRAPDTTRLHAERLFPEIPIFRDMAPQLLRQLARIAGRRTFLAGETIIRMGESGMTMYVIRSGRVEVVLERPAGPIFLASLGPGDFFGEQSIFDGEVRSATVTAVEETETLTLWQVDVMQMVQRSPELAWSLLQSLSSRLREANARLGGDRQGP
jgi:CRP/FNR family transcriptional regulator/CRP/FNR family cyclic AMP-dependent transcriptional regulator